MLADYHMHTTLCKHAEGTVQEYAEMAALKKLTEICFTDHCPAPGGYDPVNRMLLSQFSEYTQMIRSVQASVKLPVLFGIEADFYPDCERFLSDWLPAQNFDFVLGSVHYIKDWAFDDPRMISIWRSANVEQAWREYFKLVAELAETGMYDSLSHPDLPKKFGYRPSDTVISEIVQPALDAIAKAGMCIEINSSGLRRTVKEIYPSPGILSLARERNIPITFGSDAHSPNEVAHAFDLSITLAKEAGYTQFARYKNRKRTLHPLPA